MTILLIGPHDYEEKEAPWQPQVAVLPNRKVLAKDGPMPLKSMIEDTIKVRSERYTEKTGEQHMPVEKLFDTVQNSYSTQVCSAIQLPNDKAKKLMKEAGIV